MGYQPDIPQYTLDFTGTPDEGLHLVMSSVTVAQWNEMLAAAVGGPITEETLKGNARVLERFAGAIVSWDLESAQGSPVPATLDGVASQERSFISRLVTAWQKTLIGADNPLPGRSPAGGTSPEEASLQLAGASQSPPG